MKDKYLNIIKEAPEGFGIEDSKKWEKTFPHIGSWDEISHLYEHPQIKNKKDYQALSVFTYQSYLWKDINKAIHLVKGNWKEKIEYQNLHPNADIVTLYGNKSKQLDFSSFGGLKKLNVIHCRNVEEIILPNHSKLESFQVLGGRQLRTIRKLDSLEEVKYLEISKCNKFKDFDFIAKLKKLVVLNLSDNNRLTNINFLREHPNIIYLFLIKSKVIKSPSTIEILMSLPKLKWNQIAANKKERLKLKEYLPNLY